MVMNLIVADMLAGGIFTAQTFLTLGRQYDCKFSIFTLDSYCSAFSSDISAKYCYDFFTAAHTTLRPFKHRVIKRWGCGVAIAVVWVLAAIVSASLVLHESEIT